MKKILSALTVSAFIMMAATSCKKSQDVMPIAASDVSNSVLAINDSITLDYTDSGVCAMVHGLPSSQATNYNNFPSFQATVWTYLGIPAPRRSLMKFGFGRVPPACTPQTLVSAKLYLYQGDELGNTAAYYVLNQISNDAEIRRIKTTWNPATVTWSTQPAYFPGLPGPSKNAVAISQIATPFIGNQDNQVVDVTDMVKQMLQPNKNFGFEIQFPVGRETQAYKGRTYGSFTNSNLALRPVLKLYWQ